MGTEDMDVTASRLEDRSPAAASRSREREPWTYRCAKHNYVLESKVPKMPTSLRIFCPLCKDEWFAQHLTELQNENPNAGKYKEPSNGQ